MAIDSKIPDGPLEEKWGNYKEHAKLVNPANKRKMEIIVVGTGLAGASAAATFAELGYKVKAFCFQDSPRRAHSIAAQGGINAAKNYKNDGDSTYRLFYDTIKGGDFRSREANVYRLASVSADIIDQCTAQGVPFAREYGGLLDNRSFGGVQVSRTFYARGQTGQQLLLGAYQALERQIGLGNVEMYSRHEMVDVVTIDGKSRGIIARNLITGALERYFGHAVVLATGGYGNVFYLSTNAMGSNVTAAWKAHKKGAYFGNPCYTQIHPTCIPVSGEYQSKLTLMSESLRNDGRVWVPKSKEDAKAIRDGKKKAEDIAEGDRDYYLERKYPSFGNLSPRDIASRAAKEACDDGRGIVPSGFGVFLDFADAINRLGIEVVKARYGELFPMYQNITNEDPLKTPMKIYPAVHYTMGGLWVDYELMTSVQGLYCLGEANFSDHGANRLGASALMQGLADGYFVVPYTIGNYLANEIFTKVIPTDHPAFAEAEKTAREKMDKILAINGKQSAEDLHRKLGKIMWEYCGMSRSAEGLTKARKLIVELRNEFWTDVKVPGTQNELNSELDKAGRVADFIELGELMVIDALNRNESCGGHFREEYQEGGEAKRDDENYLNVSAWEFTGVGADPVLHKEELKYENIKLQVRSYK
jgi:succinate dehydrogenase / fumarate reductase flavoprotein subunit